jgi:quinate dehydrogenase
MVSTAGKFPKEARGAGVVIGGGATTRSAVYALSTMGLHPIYLCNRDVNEVCAGM